jgi:hypothetical protein
MEVRDGFIVGIFNYCDSWCERCALTSHCRLFADQARIEAAVDPNFTPVTEAPVRPEEVPFPPPPWLQQLLEGFDETEVPPADQLERMRPQVSTAHRPIVARATQYATRTHKWLTESQRDDPGAPSDAVEVVAWFHFSILSKTRRALTSWPDDEPDDLTCASDKDGSAKVALLGIERSELAWRDLIERGAITQVEGALFLADLEWLAPALEHARPGGRSFVRPAFDEPQALASFLEGEEAWS